MNVAQFHHERVPRIILILGAIGTPIAAYRFGPLASIGFALGTIASWLNYRSLQNVVAALARAAEEGGPGRLNRNILWMFIRLLLLAGVVLVILKYSKISVIALGIGLFTACAAICVEIIRELLWNTKSG